MLTAPTGESTVAAAAGVAAGFGLFFLIRPLLADISFTTTPFFRGDLSLSAADALLVALCVTSTAVGVITSIVAERGVPQGSREVRTTVIGDYAAYSAQGRPTGTVATPSGALLAALHAVPGVRGVTAIHSDPDYVPRPGPAMGGGLAACAQLAAMPVFGTCPPGAATATVSSSFDAIGLQDGGGRPKEWPAAARTPAELDRLPVEEIVVTTDGSQRAVEQARTNLATAHPSADDPYTVGEDRDRMSQELDGYRQLADVVIAVGFPVAGCSLAVGVAGGLSDRRRPFSLLRLAGVRIGVLRRVVLLESALPLFAVAAVAIGTGFLAARLFLEAQLHYSLRWPGVSYYLIVAGGLAAALAVIASTRPLLHRITAPETVRNE